MAFAAYEKSNVKNEIHNIFIEYVFINRYLSTETSKKLVETFQKSSESFVRIKFLNKLINLGFFLKTL